MVAWFLSILKNKFKQYRSQVKLGNDREKTEFGNDTLSRILQQNYVTLVFLLHQTYQHIDEPNNKPEEE